MQVAVLPDASVTLMLTGVVVPAATIGPAAGDWLMRGFAGGVTLSAAVTSPVRSGMTAVQPVFVVRILLVAQLGMVGGSLSTTLIVNEQLGPALFAQVTVVAPTEKKEP